MEKKMFLDATQPVFENAAALRKSMTSAEKILWAYLRLRPLGYKFRRQHAISKYIADFYCHSLKLVIEVDGGIHSIVDVSTKDRIRQEFLESEGIRFLRFTNLDIEMTIEGVKNSIESYIRSLDMSTPS
jgi:cyclase